MGVLLDSRHVRMGCADGAARRGYRRGEGEPGGSPRCPRTAPSAGRAAANLRGVVPPTPPAGMEEAVFLGGRAVDHPAAAGPAADRAAVVQPLPRMAEDQEPDVDDGEPGPGHRRNPT
jgi:hypothetical protein